MLRPYTVRSVPLPDFRVMLLDKIKQLLHVRQRRHRRNNSRIASCDVGIDFV